MPTYKFWYKKEIKARSLDEAMRMEKQSKIQFDSVQEHDDQSERELTPLIGFSIPTESDEEDW